MKFISLFSGIGGFDLGFELAGMTCIGQVEIDRAARAVLARHWPDVKRVEDIRNVGGDTFESVDLVCGGFPCQDLSVAGKREGLAGSRSGLWWQFRKVIREYRPRWVVIENVPGLLSSNNERDFGIVIRGLVKCGYGVAWRVFDSQYFGLAQRRERVFVVASLGDGNCAEILFEREGGGWDIAPSKAAGKISPTLTESGVGTGRTGNERTELDFVIAQTLTGGGGDKRGYIDPVNATMVLAKPLGAHHAPRYDLDNETYVVSPTVSSKWAKETGGPSGDEVQNIVVSFTARRNGDGLENLSPTVSSGTGAFGAPGVAGGELLPRRLTPTECERLQGFPDGWTAGQADSPRYRQLGNAVSVPVLEWIGKRILKSELAS